MAQKSDLAAVTDNPVKQKEIEAVEKLGGTGLKFESNDHGDSVLSLSAGTRKGHSNEAGRVEFLETGEKGDRRIHVTNIHEEKFARGLGAIDILVGKLDQHAARVGTNEIKVDLGGNHFTPLDRSEKSVIMESLLGHNFEVSYRYLEDGKLSEAVHILPGEKIALEHDPVELHAIKGVHFQSRNSHVSEIQFKEPDQKNNDQLTRLKTADVPTEGKVTDGNLEILPLDKAIESIQHGQIPDQYDLPANVYLKMDELMKKSYGWGTDLLPQREHSAILIKESEGLNLSHISRGGQGSVTPERELPGEDALGLFHTHPYEKPRLTGMAFSGADVQYIVYDSDTKVMIAQCGDDLFTLVRTNETPSGVITNSDNISIAKEINDLYEMKSQEYAMQNLDGVTDEQKMRDAILYSNYYACQKYHLVMYQGKNGEPQKRIN